MTLDGEKSFIKEKPKVMVDEFYGSSEVKMIEGRRYLCGRES
jgi:hypothetical protein